MSQGMETAQPTLRHLGWKDVLSSVLGLAIVIGLIAWGMPHLLETSWKDIWAQLSRVRPSTAVAMGALLLAGWFCYTWVLIGSLPGLRHFKALQTNAVSAVVSNVLPLGAAVGIALTWTMWRTWGFGKRAISTSILVTGIWNVLARVTLPVIGCLVLVAGPIEAPRVVVIGAGVAGTVGAAVVVVCALMIFSDRVAAWVSRALHAVLSPFSRRVREGQGIDHLVTDQRRRVEEVVRAGWLPMTLGMSGQFLLLFGLYWLAARVVGLDVPMAELICAYAFRQLLTVIAITPGGLGVTEVGTAGLLILFGGSAGAASATALLYAIYAHLLVVPFGVAALGAWWVRTGRVALASGQLSPPGSDPDAEGEPAR
ncbi:MAG: lysylphosphatidylglycerol synthase transmembrane domain-containing protein [Ornithinimicrobium sp.]|uniref:lysylphosphatidylglycerol synthase transmembrane domain-containing protein n=1 Tax=Ornithinimicrobium sp. TaxID=1977084 RepID=UPI0026E0D8C9|nr:lysylphosphatidylglycerol synthase transmembrane domain-containing protein [Ornithinimicrobium sp.]MDO5738855.1 lysylphosphatidylglycerol synthase transmembrane domain-containing protein [Ornithinimicrobium sp.]